VRTRGGGCVVDRLRADRPTDRGQEVEAATDEAAAAAAGIQDWGPGELYPHPEGPATPERATHACCTLDAATPPSSTWSHANAGRGESAACSRIGRLLEQWNETNPRLVIYLLYLRASRKRAQFQRLWGTRQTLRYVPARWCCFLFARFAAGGPCGVVHGRAGQGTAGQGRARAVTPIASRFHGPTGRIY
jgi:hypothetical protein